MPHRDTFDGTFEIQVKKQTIEWIQPARFNDVVEISTWVSRFGKSSFDVRFEMRVPPRPEPIVVADCVYVHVTGTNGVWKSAPMPEDARRLLEAGARGRIVDHAGYLQQAAVISL